MSLSVRGSFTTIKAIINLALAEHGLDMRNPFSSIFMPEADSKKKVSIPVETIREIQQACYDIDDDRRWLIAPISDTGMSLIAEAAVFSYCLTCMMKRYLLSDLAFTKDGTETTTRFIGIQRIRQTGLSCLGWYSDNQQCRANSASNALNKWMQTHFRDDIVIHGFTDMPSDFDRIYSAL